MRLRCLLTILTGFYVSFNAGLCNVEAGDSKSPGRGISVDEFLPKLKFNRVTEPLVSLLELSRQSHATVAKIHTWTGRVRFEDREFTRDEPVGIDIGCFGMARGSYQLPLERRTEGSGRFEYDVTTERYFSELMVERATVVEMNTRKYLLTQLRMPLEGGGWADAPVYLNADLAAKIDSRYKLNLLFWKRSVVTSGEHLSIEPAKQYPQFLAAPGLGPPLGRSAFKDEPGTATEQQLSTVLRPASFFFLWSNLPNWIQLEELATRYQKALDTEEISETAFAKRLIVEHAQDDFGHVYRLQIYTGEGDDRKKWTEFSAYFHENVGYLPLLAEVQSGAGHSRTALFWDYDVSNGFIHPRLMNRIITGPDPKYLSFQRSVQVIDSEVNAPIPEDHFTLAALEMKDGERLMDRVEGKLFVLKDGQLELATASHRMNPEALKPASTRWRLMLVAVNAVVIAGVALIFVARRRAARH